MKIPIVLVLPNNLLLGNFSTLEPETPELDVFTYRMVWADSDGNELRETENKCKRQLIDAYTITNNYIHH